MRCAPLKPDFKERASPLRTSAGAAASDMSERNDSDLDTQEVIGAWVLTTLAIIPRTADPASGCLESSWMSILAKMEREFEEFY